MTSHRQQAPVQEVYDLKVDLLRQLSKKEKLPDYVKEQLRKKRQFAAPANFAEARKLYKHDPDNDRGFSENMKRYRRYRIRKLLNTLSGQSKPQSKGINVKSTTYGGLSLLWSSLLVWTV